MTDPASAKRELDQLIDEQITLFEQRGPLGPDELFEFQLRVAEIQKVCRYLEQLKAPPPWRVQRTRRVHPSL
jgi:hypothetical protein